MLGIGYPRAITQCLEAARHQGVELGQGILLADDLLHLGHAQRGQAQAQPGHQQGNQGSRRHGHAQQALLAHASGRQHGHLTFQVQAPVSQEDAEEQPQRQDQLQEAWQAEAHDQEQHARVEHALGSLGQVLDEAPAHDDHQQHSADGAQGDQDLAGQITKDDQTRHSWVVRADCHAMAPNNDLVHPRPMPVRQRRTSM